MPVPLHDLLTAAPYLHALNLRHGDWLGAALGDPDHALTDELGALAASGDQTTVAAALRAAKGRVALLAAVAETSGRWTTAQATAALSDLADRCLEVALEFLLAGAVARGQLMPGTHAANCGLAIFALGKHGGRELNYSSDIDIVAFFDPEVGVLTDPTEATKVFSRLVQKLAGLMEERIGGGYVFRTDLRLRPDPGSTPVALPVDAALIYYESRGQNWERAAWIKARPAAGDKRVGHAFLKELAPYIWRKHLDFAAIADIQAMKRQINVAKKVGDARTLGHNVKLGPGGIREIEFFTQTQQLIAGGRDPRLRVRSTSEALTALAEAGWIKRDAARALIEAYWFLRSVENRLQMRRDEQTHAMPQTVDEMAIVALIMGFAATDDFELAYRARLAVVQAHYMDLFKTGETLGAGDGNLVFTGADDDPETLDTLMGMGFKDASLVARTVRKWHYGGYRATRAAVARAHLTELLPVLLGTLARTGDADLALARFDNFLGRLPAGVQLFALLRGQKRLLSLLVDLLAAAPRMADAVIHRAHIMDALIDPAFADDLDRPDVMAQKVEAFMGEARDYQEAIERARIVGLEQKFLVAVGLLSAGFNGSRAGELFTALAETLLQKLFAATRAEFERRHGVIAGARVGLLAFGKMASREMTAASDLDFILLYDIDDPARESGGDRPLPASQYFARLTQRLVAAVTAPTSEGVLYEVDMRLRPSGNSGPLATSLAAFSRYQAESAWTWEHLALTRARVVMADGDLKFAIDGAIARTLALPRDKEKTVADVVAMRARLAAERPPRHVFDLKLAGGGLVDLEFLAQSAQLLTGEAIARPQAPTAAVLARLGDLGLVPEGARLAQIHALYTDVSQIMSAALIDPFDDGGWTGAFRDLLAKLTFRPDLVHLTLGLDDMQGEVRAAGARWYARG